MAEKPTRPIVKKNLDVFDKREFLPENFESILKSIRASHVSRLKRLGIIDR